MIPPPEWLPELVQCTNCKLHKVRKQVVLPDGPYDAKYLLLGEAPGNTEDEGGRPFIGAAGDNLNLLLGQAGISRDEVLIVNRDRKSVV